MGFFSNLYRVLEKYGVLFLQGAGCTLALSAVTVLAGTLVGALLAIVRIAAGKSSGGKILNGIVTAYVEILRGTPLLLQLYFFYFLLPQMLPFDINEITSITLALCINSSAYVSEIIRAGIQAVDRGQTEAARSLGLNGKQTMIHVVLPQAIKNILPALGNEFVTMIKETSLAATFFIGDIMTQYKLVSSATYLNLEPLAIAAVVYFVLTFGLSRAVNAFERRLHAGD